MNKELECLKRIDTKNYLTEREHKEFLGVVEQALHRLESIENANPSEALECLEEMWELSCDSRIPEYTLYETIKQALLKSQEPKQYLKWEDLEFDNNASVKKHLKVKLGDNIYKAYYHYCFILNSELFCIENDNENLNIYITNRQFFNDLHLERVEE